MTVKIALYKGRGQIGNAAIRLWTGSIYSHCELVVGGWCYSSSVMDKGVRSKRVGPSADEISLNEDHWDLIELPWADGAAIVRYFEVTDRDVYGWPSLIASQVFNRNQPSEHAAFCSEWCARALSLPSPSIYNPGTLGDFCHWRNNLAA
ncbi:hypothetical protein [Pseudomonas leptonychotis]|uniref:hypothetical protein n=1 Tax=Pseudomonas leptonychotis TaxID=2448482 RepID=UPI00386F84D9